MTRRFEPPAEGLSYFVLALDDEATDLPVRYWYEIDADGSCLRQVELYRDGARKRDAVSNDPGGATDVGFGTLHGVSFWELEWDDEAQVSSRQDFEMAWSA